MIRGEQKGPHQQVRFWLSLSVLPTAPGITSPAGPVTGPHPELCPRPGEEVRPAGPAPWHHPQYPDTHSNQPQSQDGHQPWQVLPGAALRSGQQHPPPFPTPPAGILELSLVGVLLEARRLSLRSGDLHRPWDPGQPLPQRHSLPI